MADVKLSSKNQIVVPREAREALRIKPGARLWVVVRGNLVILLRTPRHYADAIAGIGKGVYGKAYLDKERASWR